MAVSYFYAPFVSDGPVICPLRASTGLDCPGCGLTRSFCAMARGRFADAAAFHWLGPALFLAAALAAPILIYEVIRRREVAAMHRVLFSKPLAWLIAALLVTNWAYHMVEHTLSGDLLASMRGSWAGLMIRVAAGWM